MSILFLFRPFYLALCQPIFSLSLMCTRPFPRHFLEHSKRYLNISQPRLFTCTTARAFPGYPSVRSNQQRTKFTMTGKQEAHQYQAGDSTHRKEDEWKHREPYRIHDPAENFEVKWEGECHCGRVQYQLSREKPLAAKYCHCTTCQRLHGVSLSMLILRTWVDESIGPLSVGCDLPQVGHQLHLWPS